MQDLILLHGAIGSNEQFNELSELLKEHYYVHVMDFSGHGSSSSNETFSIELFANDVLSYMDQKGLKTVNIFGYSMGGYVALYLAKHNPEKITKAFTFATKFNWDPEIAVKEIKMLDPEKIEIKLPAFAKALESRHSGNNWKTVLNKTADMMISLGEKNCLSLTDYTSIENPVQIGIGDKDTMVTLEETITVYRNLKNARLLVMPETQHPIERIDKQRLKNEILYFFN
jgi:esterase/lipase